MTATGQPTADQIVEDEVRELVRRRGLDPGDGDAVAVRQLIDEVVTDYADRRLVASMPPLADAGQVAKAVADRVIGMGPLQPFFDDPDVEEIWINEPGKVFVAKAGRPQLTTTVLSEEHVHDLVELMLRASGRRVDLSSPFVDATLGDGSRLHVVIPDITRHQWAINIRRFVLRAHSLDELVRLGTMSGQCARFLEAAVVTGLNIVVAGATQSGKTTTLNCLAAAIPPRERVITCEEVFELQVGLPDTVAMQTRQPNLEGEGEIRQRRLIKEALRMRPDRLLVGEVRQEECLDLLIAFNSGIPGMTSVHANSAREALVKLTTLPLLAGENVSHRPRPNPSGPVRKPPGQPGDRAGPTAAPAPSVRPRPGQSVSMVCASGPRRPGSGLVAQDDDQPRLAVLEHGIEQAAVKLRDVTAAAPHALYPVTGHDDCGRLLSGSPGWEPHGSCGAGGSGRDLASGQPGSRTRASPQKGGQGPYGGGLLAPRFAVRHRWNQAGLEADVTAGGAGALLLSRARRTAPAGRTPAPFLSETRTLSARGPPRGRGRPPGTT